VCRLKISASAVELGFEDDFWEGRDSVFINGLSVRSSLFAHKMSASDVELGFWMIFGSQGPRFRQRFLRQQ
jgi:hypothetical protein